MPSSGSTSSTARASRSAALTPRHRERRPPRRASREPRASRAPSWRRSSPAESTRSSSRATARPVSMTSSSVGPYFLVEPEEQVAPPLDLLEPRRIEIDRAGVLLAARARAPRARSRRCRTAPAGGRATDRCAESPPARACTAASCSSTAASSSPSSAAAIARASVAQLLGVLEPARFVLEAHILAVLRASRVSISLADVPQIVRAPLRLGTARR